MRPSEKARKRPARSTTTAATTTTTTQRNDDVDVGESWRAEKEKVEEELIEPRTESVEQTRTGMNLGSDLKALDKIQALIR